MLPVKVVTKPDGRRYIYRRVGKRLVRLPAADDPGFLAAYEAARVTPIPRAKAGTVAALCLAYQASDRWKTLAASTRAMRCRVLRKITEKGMAALVRGLTADHVRQDIRNLKPGPALQRLKVWRVLLTFAKRAGLPRALRTP